VSVVRASAEHGAPVGLAARLWTDTGRWATFIDGFVEVLEQDQDWPEPGAKLVWRSGPAGRGRVTERVLERSEQHFVTEVFEEQLHGRQTVWFEPGSVVMELDYELPKRGVLQKLTDVLFIRRAVAMALDRTLTRFAREAEDEATL
jgi:polyketide cyclase/dehydrase/lipid transport protein